MSIELIIQLPVCLKFIANLTSIHMSVPQYDKFFLTIRLVCDNVMLSIHCIRQIIRGEKLSWFSWIFANHECFTFEIFP